MTCTILVSAIQCVSSNLYYCACHCFSSDTIRSFVKKGITICLNPEAKIERIYQLTPQGKEIRMDLLKQMKTANSFEEKLKIHREIQKLPRNSSPVRVRNRCLITGRSRGYFKDFGLSRHCLREMAHQCLLHGVTKASW